MKLMKCIPIVLGLALLLGCGAANTETEAASPTESQTLQTEPIPTTQTTEPPTEVPTQPPVVLDAGPAVFVNGIQIQHSGRCEGTVYVNAEEFCLIMGGNRDENGIISLDFHSDIYSFSSEHSHMTKNGKAVVLRSPVLSMDGAAYLPLEEICQLTELSLFWDTEFDVVYCTAAAWPREVPQGYDVPVFMYHAVSNDTWGIDELFVMPERMEEQLKYLTENGYDPIFFEDLYHVEDYDKPVILTFDDGYADNYTELFPLLKKYNTKATIFIITGYVNQENYLTTDQIREMADSGLVSFQSHTVTHPYLDEQSYEQQQMELIESKLHVTRLSRREPYVLCYPTGKYNSDTLSILPECYQFALKMQGGLYTTGGNPYLINRYYVAREDTIYWFRGVLEDIFD